MDSIPTVKAVKSQRQKKIKSRSPELLFITRMEYERAHGWFLRVSIQGRNLVSKLFSDRKCGGRDAALVAAIQERDKHLEIHRATLAVTPVNRCRHMTGARSVSGFVGVSPSASKFGDRITGWIARWQTDAGESNKMYFSVSDYGYVGAFQRALEKRREMTGAVFHSDEPPSEAVILRKLANR
jgi:hypothetical protein